jgi:hypothetical protein
MKTIFKRTLMVTLLATSITAFAKSGDAKPDDAVAPTNVIQQNDCSQKANDMGKQNEQKSSDEQKIEQEDRDWLHDFQGDAYGG